jgi:hypothetical protein
MAGVDRIAGIRSRLAESVQVASLSPGVVHVAIWAAPDRSGLVSGRASVLRLGKHDAWVIGRL